MNTQGWIRGLIAHNSSLDKYIELVSSTISREFELEFKLLKKNDFYVFSFANYEIVASILELNTLQKHGPYALDKYILEKLSAQGFIYDIHRSQYIETVMCK